MDSAFTARFKFIGNRKKKSGNDCDRYLLIDFTPEEAKKAAKWLTDQATAAETPGGSSIRKYSSRTDYEEIPGFTNLAASGQLILIQKKNGLMAEER